MATSRPSLTLGAMRIPFAGSERSCMDGTIGELSRKRQDNSASLGLDASRRGLEEPNHSKSEPPVAQGSRAVADTLGKVTDDIQERLARLDMRAPTIAGAIANLHPPDLLGCLRDVDPAVVHLDRLGGI